MSKPAMTTPRQASERWSRLASVARQRAAEQKRFAAEASDAAAAEPHVEQHAHLTRLAEDYERQAMLFA